MDVTAALADVHRRISSAGGDPGEIRVVAVTKAFGPEAVVAARAAGLFDCGENYAQSLLEKVPAVPADTRWHFLGPVQRNKVKALAQYVALWQGIDRESAGAEVARRAPGAAVLVQVNLTGDPARPGCSWAEAPELVDRLGDLGLDVRGLMGVAAPDLEAARLQFRRLATLADALGLAERSMGMSGDLEVAIQEGATTVRIGTSLFGARPGSPQVRR